MTTLMEKLQDEWHDMWYTLRDFREWLIRKYITRYDIVKTDLNRNKYYEVSDRLLHANFSLLKDFVEQEIAWKQVSLVLEDRHLKPKWYNTYTWRCRECGIRYLDWEIELINDKDVGYPEDHKDYGKPTQQALTAREIKDLYLWWVDIRPARRDPYEESGWNNSETRRQNIAATIKLLDKLEAVQFDEDTTMLTRLIKIRNDLWT